MEALTVQGKGKAETGKMESSPCFIAIAANTKAGKGKAIEVMKQLEWLLKARNIAHIVFPDRWPEDFSGYTAIWLVGGDGTLNYFINRYPALSVPIALFKGGIGNDFAWKLYGNLPVAAYAEFVLTHSPKRVDAGVCNGRYFINGMGVGFDGEVVKAMGRKRYLSAGHLAYLLLVLKKIFFYREPVITISSGSWRQEGAYFMLTIANGSRYGGGFMVAPLAKIDDGLFDIVLIKPMAALKRILRLPVVEKGKHLKKDYVVFTRGTGMTIRGRSVLTAHLDGELLQADFLEITLLPGKYLFYHLQ
jgi:diacylglycerol kinase family enzyme